jgi:hypothetical protein
MTEHIVHQPTFSAIPYQAVRDSLATVHRFAHPRRSTFSSAARHPPADPWFEVAHEQVGAAGVAQLGAACCEQS